MQLYTKTGDMGTTGLFGGMRVPKSSPKVMAYGQLDAASAQIGLLKSVVDDPPVVALLTHIQETLIIAATLLASDGSTAPPDVESCEVALLEEHIDLWQQQLPTLEAWVLAGDDVVSAHAHVARTAVRTAERSISALSKTTPKRYEGVLMYVNRLSDFLFVLARRLAFQTVLSTVKTAVVKRLGATAFSCADAAIDACMAQAAALDIAVCVAVVDAAGHLVAFKRMPEALIGSIDIACAKAKTAVKFRCTTGALGEQALPGQPLYGIENCDAVIFGGGFPAMRGDVLIGGIGVSGGSVEQDEAVAREGLEKLQGG